MLMDRPHRTFISSVLFLDIVGYTKQPVTEQIRLKEQFNTLVSHLISDIPESDRIVLDTGDGAALSFLGDPEDALFVAVKLRDAITEKQEAEFPDLHLRMGINLGPVKLLKDINGRPNLIGDGINVAQRVMNFAEPDQILVSRSFYDVVSCLSDEYRDLFSHQGMHTDKHVREHELYEIGFVDPDRSVTINQRMRVLENRTRIPQEHLAQLERALEPHVGDHAHVLVQAKAMNAADFGALRAALAAYVPDPQARAAFARIEPGMRGPGRKYMARWLPAAVAGVCAVAALGWWLLHPGATTPDDTRTARASDQEGKAAPTAAPSPATSAKPPKDPDIKPAGAAATEDKSVKAEKKSARDAAKDAKGARGPAPTPAAPPAGNPAPQAREAPAAAGGPRERNASLRFQINGYADVYVDGARIGASGSVTQLAVTPGEHRIELRNCGFPPDTKHQSVSVQPNDSKLVVAAC